MSVPILTIIAGANGCGKSTLTKWARAFFQQTATLDPDAVAVELQAELSRDVSPIEAGKLDHFACCWVSVERCAVAFSLGKTPIRAAALNYTHRQNGLVLLTAENYLQKGVSFSVETTLSGSTYLRMLLDARHRGYRTCLFYIGTRAWRSTSHG